jgi:AsmA protein
MNRILKILLGVVAGIVLLAVIAAVLLPLVYDTEDLKRTLETRISKQTGRELRIAGDLDFSVFPWLAVAVDELSLSNAPGFGDQPFARVGQARIGVALLPLLRKELVADEITLIGLELDLAVDASGRSNWEDLVSEEPAAEPAPDGGPFSSQQIAGLNIREANIVLRDQQAGTHYVLSGLDLQTGALGGSGPVPVELSARLEDRVADSVMDVALTARARADLDAERYDFEDLELKLDLADAGDSLILTAPSVSADLAAQTLAIDAFTAKIAGLQASGGLKGRNILDEASLSGRLATGEFSPKAVMAALGMEAPVTADPGVLGRARLESAFDGSAAALSLQGLVLELDDSRLSGTFGVSDFDQPRVRFDLAVDSIDLDRYLAPAAEEESDEDVALPTEAVRGVDVQGTLRAAKLRLAGLDLSEATVGVNVREGRLRLNPLTAGFYGGTYSGDVTLDGAGEVPVLSLDENVESIVFQRLLGDLAATDRLSGTALGHLRASGRGDTLDAMLGSLDGELNLRLDEGALEGVNIWYEIRKGLALFQGRPAPAAEPDRTVFSRLQFDAAIDGGVLRTRELIGELPFLTLTGDGTIDLAAQKVDLDLIAAVRNMPELAQDPLTAELKGKSMPLSIRGPLTGPGISVDWQSMLKTKAQEKILEKLLGDEQEQPAAEGESTEKSESDQRKDAARDLLRGLLGDKKKDEGSDDGN